MSAKVFQQSWWWGLVWVLAGPGAGAAWAQGAVGTARSEAQFLALANTSEVLAAAVASETSVDPMVDLTIDTLLYHQQAKPIVQAAVAEIECGDWDRALAILARGRRVLDGTDLQTIKQWEIEVYTRWARRLRDERQFAAGIAVLRRGVQCCGLEALEDPIDYFAHEALRVSIAQHEIGRAGRVLAELRQAFPDFRVLDSVGRARAAEAIEPLLAVGRYDEAMGELELLAPVLTRRGEAQAAREEVYRRWGVALCEMGKWQQALAVLRTGMNVCTESDVLIAASVATYDAWAQSFIDRKSWSEAIAVYDRGLRAFPTERQLSDHRDECRRHLK